MGGRAHLNHLLLLFETCFILFCYCCPDWSDMRCVFCTVSWLFFCDAVVRITDTCENIPHCFCASPRASYAGAMSALRFPEVSEAFLLQAQFILKQKREGGCIFVQELILSVNTCNLCETSYF